MTDYDHRYSFNGQLFERGSEVVWGNNKFDTWSRSRLRLGDMVTCKTFASYGLELQSA